MWWWWYSVLGLISQYVKSFKYETNARGVKLWLYEMPSLLDVSLDKSKMPKSPSSSLGSSNAKSKLGLVTLFSSSWFLWTYQYWDRENSSCISFFRNPSIQAQRRALPIASGKVSHDKNTFSFCTNLYLSIKENQPVLQPRRNWLKKFATMIFLWWLEKLEAAKPHVSNLLPKTWLFDTKSFYKANAIIFDFLVVGQSFYSPEKC